MKNRQKTKTNQNSPKPIKEKYDIESPPWVIAKMLKKQEDEMKAMAKEDNLDALFRNKKYSDLVRLTICFIL